MNKQTLIFLLLTFSLGQYAFGFSCGDNTQSLKKEIHWFESLGYDCTTSTLKYKFDPLILTDDLSPEAADELQANHDLAVKIYTNTMKWLLNNTHRGNSGQLSAKLAYAFYKGGPVFATKSGDPREVYVGNVELSHTETTVCINQKRIVLIEAQIDVKGIPGQGVCRKSSSVKIEKK